MRELRGKVIAAICLGKRFDGRGVWSCLSKNSLAKSRQGCLYGSAQLGAIMSGHRRVRWYSPPSLPSRRWTPA